jgi:hypothetical protein
MDCSQKIGKIHRPSYFGILVEKKKPIAGHSQARSTFSVSENRFFQRPDAIHPRLTALKYRPRRGTERAASEVVSVDCVTSRLTVSS